MFVFLFFYFFFQKSVYLLLVVRNSGEQVQNLVVLYTVGTEYLSGKLVDAPAHDQISNRNEVQDQRNGNQQHDGHVRQERHGKVG